MKDHDDLLEIVPNNTQEHILKIAITLQLIAIIDCNKAQLKLIDCKENNWLQDKKLIFDRPCLLQLKLVL